MFGVRLESAWATLGFVLLAAGGCGSAVGDGGPSTASVAGTCVGQQPIAQPDGSSPFAYVDLAFQYGDVGEIWLDSGTVAAVRGVAGAPTLVHDQATSADSTRFDFRVTAVLASRTNLPNDIVIQQPGRPGTILRGAAPQMVAGGHYLAFLTQAGNGTYYISGSTALWFDCGDSIGWAGGRGALNTPRTPAEMAATLREPPLRWLWDDPHTEAVVVATAQRSISPSLTRVQVSEVVGNRMKQLPMSLEVSQSLTPNRTYLLFLTGGPPTYQVLHINYVDLLGLYVIDGQVGTVVDSRSHLPQTISVARIRQDLFVMPA